MLDTVPVFMSWLTPPLIWFTLFFLLLHFVFKWSLRERESKKVFSIALTHIRNHPDDGTGFSLVYCFLLLCRELGVWWAGGKDRCQCVFQWLVTAGASVTYLAACIWDRNERKDIYCGDGKHAFQAFGMVSQNHSIID